MIGSLITWILAIGAIAIAVVSLIKNFSKEGPPGEKGDIGPTGICECTSDIETLKARLNVLEGLNLDSRLSTLEGDTETLQGEVSTLSSTVGDLPTKGTYKVEVGTDWKTTGSEGGIYCNKNSEHGDNCRYTKAGYYEGTANVVVDLQNGQL